MSESASQERPKAMLQMGAKWSRCAGVLAASLVTRKAGRKCSATSSAKVEVQMRERVAAEIAGSRRNVSATTAARTAPCQMAAMRAAAAMAARWFTMRSPYGMGE
jgi:hypothetical protein